MLLERKKLEGRGRCFAAGEGFSIEVREEESFDERRREFPLERERFLTWASSQRGSPEGGFSGKEEKKQKRKKGDGKAVLGKRHPGRVFASFMFSSFSRDSTTFSYIFLGEILLIGLGIKDYWLELLNMFVCIYAPFAFIVVS